MEKICTSCGRVITYRKKWEKNWDEIKYCSDECRRNKNKYDFRESILSLLKDRSPQQFLCPSEVLNEDLKTDKVMLEHVRRSARLLAHEGLVEILQNGKLVNPSEFRGPVQVRLKKS